jgi:O-antigen/teichoic acid export membrane protein
LLGLLVVADLFIQTLYGPNWQPSVLPLQILTLFALRQTVGSPATVIYNVVGRPDIGLRMGLVFLPFYLLSIWLGSFHGIVGVASAVTIVRFIYGMIQFQVIARLVGGNLRALLSPMAQPFSAALLMATVVLACRWMLSAMGVASPLLLVLLILTGGLTWLLILLRIFPQSMHEILMLVDALSTRLGSQLRRFVLPLMSLPRRAASTL